MTETVNEDDFTGSEGDVVIKSDNEPSDEDKQEQNNGFSF